MSRYKFEDCRTCRFRRRPDICEKCDFGEYFEDGSIRELSFEEPDLISRGVQSLVTDNDEPDVNPDDLIRQFDEQEANHADQEQD